MKKLIDLDPHWLIQGNRKGVGISLECPCGCDQRIGVGIKNPIDGGPPVPITFNLDDPPKPTWWTISNATDFSKISLTPSIAIWRDKKEHWHGFITNGIVTP